MLNPFRHGLLTDEEQEYPRPAPRSVQAQSAPESAVLLEPLEFLVFYLFLHKLTFLNALCRLPCNELFLMSLTDKRSRTFQM